MWLEHVNSSSFPGLLLNTLCSQIFSQQFSLKMQPSSVFGHLVGLQLIKFQNLPSFLLCQCWFHTSSATSLGLRFSLSPNIAKDVVNEFWFLLFLMLSMLFRNWSRKITSWVALNPYAPAAVQLLSCIWLFETPMDCSLPGSRVHGILQARILEWVAISSSINLYAVGSRQDVLGPWQGHGTRKDPARQLFPSRLSPGPGMSLFSFCLTVAGLSINFWKYKIQ